MQRIICPRRPMVIITELCSAFIQLAIINPASVNSMPLLLTLSLLNESLNNFSLWHSILPLNTTNSFVPVPPTLHIYRSIVANDQVAYESILCDHSQILVAKDLSHPYNIPIDSSSTSLYCTNGTYRSPNELSRLVVDRCHSSVTLFEDEKATSAFGFYIALHQNELNIYDTSIT